MSEARDSSPACAAGIRRSSTRRPGQQEALGIELERAQATINQCRAIAEQLGSHRSPLPAIPYWFARLYWCSLSCHVDAASEFMYPGFVLHFIPIFYSMYSENAARFLDDAHISIASNWRSHFDAHRAEVARLTERPDAYVRAVRDSVVRGVYAHIKGDMSAALATAYQSYSKTYSGVPAFDEFYRDFFSNSREVFDDAKLALVGEFKRTMASAGGVGTWLHTVRDDLAIKVADFLRIIPSVSYLFRLREQAWRSARARLNHAG